MNLFDIGKKNIDADRKRCPRFCFGKYYLLPFNLGILIIFSLVVSCTNTDTNSSTKEVVQTPVAITPESSPTAVAPTPTSPPVTGDGIKQEQPLTAYIKRKMTEKIWHFSTVRIINQPEKSKDYQGKWIKFNSDNTILSGFYEEPGISGKWVYDESKDILTITEGGERPVFSQWKLQFSANSDDLSIWVGTPRFQNNNTQMKMLRRAEKPQRD